MSIRKYITVSEMGNFQEYMIMPKAFIDISYYREMDVDSKFIYILLLNKARLSYKNKWFDDEGRIYFIYKNDDLRLMANIPSKQRLSKAKKELVEKHLLEQKRFGQGRPNQLYLMHPFTQKEIEENEITAQQYFKI